MLFLGQKRYRVIAHDRSSHGRSSQTWDGNHMDQYADDLAELIETLDLEGLVMIGHSTGGGEVTRYLGRHGTKRVAKLVPDAVLKVYKGAPHGLAQTHQGQLNADLLAFIKG